MNERKQKQLFEAARLCPDVKAPSDFTEQVLAAVRREEGRAVDVSLLDQLSYLFPRLATAALLIIVAGVAFGFLMTDDWLAQLSQASDQWLLPMNWL